MTEHEEFDQIFLHVKQLTTVSLNFWFGCHLLVNSTEEFHRMFWCIVCLSAKLDPLFTTQQSGVSLHHPGQDGSPSRVLNGPSKNAHHFQFSGLSCLQSLLRVLISFTRQRISQTWRKDTPYWLYCYRSLAIMQSLLFTIPQMPAPPLVLLFCEVTLQDSWVRKTHLNAMCLNKQ